MDILNWLYLKAAGLVKTTANNPDTDLIALGANVGFNKRGDEYQTYGMTLKDGVNSGNIGNTAHYELDIEESSVVTVSTPRGIIDIVGMGSGASLTPEEGFNTTVLFEINNPDLDLTVANRDNVYVQYSVYYSKTSNDNAIPYLISTGYVPTGLEFNLYNANPATADDNNWQGSLYVYYELYTIN